MTKPAPFPIPQHERGTASIDELKPAPYNPRRIDKAAKRALRTSLERFGLVQDIVVNRRTGHVVGGHQRLDQLREMGHTEVPVVWVDLDDANEKALNVTLNSPFVSGEFDTELLSLVLDDIREVPGLTFAELRLDDLAELPERTTTSTTTTPAKPRTSRPLLTDPSQAVVLCGDMREHLAAMPEASVDAIVCDPPYEISFMGRAWDASGVAYDPTTWAACLRVLKPGGHLLAFGATRTWHRIAVAIEDAGFEVRDSLAWLYGQGFPKSLDVSKAIDARFGHEQRSDYEPNHLNTTHGKGFGGGRTTLKSEPATDDARRWQGWGSALKPAFEPVVLARKPLDGTLVDNVLRYGTGAIDVDGCRIGTTGGTHATAFDGTTSMFGIGGAGPNVDAGGRWPANVALDDDAARMLDEQAGDVSENAPATYRNATSAGMFGIGAHGAGHERSGFGDSGGPSRFFYTSKASTSEREDGLGDLPLRPAHELVHQPEGAAGMDSPRAGAGRTSASGRANFHPTVKPVDLMRWLVRMVTPPGGLVVDPFCGSGTTGVAAVHEGVRFIGIELDTAHATIAWRRIENARSELAGVEPVPVAAE